MIEDDQGIAAHGGVLISAVFLANFSMEDRAKSYPRTLAKALSTVKQKIEELKEVYALEDGEEATAPRLLKWFGFAPVGMVDGQVLHKWTQ